MQWQCDCNELGMSVALKGMKGYMMLPGEIGGKKGLSKTMSDLEIGCIR